jgi:hypothetical protein
MQLGGWVQWCMSVIPATQEAETWKIYSEAILSKKLENISNNK